MDDWYLAERKTVVKNCMIERIIHSTSDPSIYELYGVEVLENGQFGDIQFIDIIEERDRDKVKLKSWLRQSLTHEVYLKKGDYFARRFSPVLAVTMVYNETADLWERLEILGGGKKERQDPV